jgi:hypothetical protein
VKRSTRAVMTAVLICIAGALAPAAATASPRFTENGGDNATVRNCPPSSGCGYVMGNLLQGDTFDRSYDTGNGWYYGYLYGGYNGCAWVSTSNLNGAGNGGSVLCSASGTGISASTFAQDIRADASGQDGVSANIDYGHTNCTDHGAYANVHPWDTNSTSGLDRYGTAPDGAYVKYRYTSINGQWAMVHDSSVGSRGYVSPRGGTPSDWYFVRRNCVTIQP